MVAIHCDVMMTHQLLLHDCYMYDARIIIIIKLIDYLHLSYHASE